MHVHPCCRLTPVRALQTTSPATSSTISFMNQSTGTSTTCSTTRCCTRSRGTCCTPSRICGTGSATICSTTICSRLVTRLGTRRTQFHNVCKTSREHHVNHMTTCPRTSRVQATSHIPRLTEVKRACVLRDVRDSQGAPSPALLFWLRPAAVLARLVTKGVTQKRSKNETGLRSTLLPFLCCLIPRTYIEPFWIALTPERKAKL